MSLFSECFVGESVRKSERPDSSKALEIAKTDMWSQSPYHAMELRVRKAGCRVTDLPEEGVHWEDDENGERHEALNIAARL